MNEKIKTTRDNIPIDTQFILILRNKPFERLDYQVIKLSNLDREGCQINSTKRIELTKQNKTIAIISLPYPDEEIKNFSVNKIEETINGFKIFVDWGGGNYFYGRCFYFNFKNGQFYLDSLNMKSYVLEPEKHMKITKKIRPPIVINEFMILHYLENE
jgi:hypothetical protein